MTDPGNIKPVIFDAKYIIPKEIVDDVICRFLLNIPKEEKFDSVRVCFQIELAHWFFVDHYCGETCAPLLAALRNIPYNQFAYLMFQKTPHLKPRLAEIDKHLSAFREYKMRVPTYGAILLNKNLTKLVLVQGFRNHWGFPKGKVNEVEEPVSCAIREVFEETGYDISSLVNANHYIESRVMERTDRLYIVRGVDPKFNFEPQTQFEIKSVKWFNVHELPEHKKDANPAVTKNGVPTGAFYSVYPYIKRLKSWIADKVENRNKIENFKVRSDNEPADSQQHHQHMVSNHQKSNRNAVGPQNIPAYCSIPFQSNQHQFLPTSVAIASAPMVAGGGGGGYTLFQGENKPYVMNSNAIQELLLSSQKSLSQQQQNTMSSGPSKSKQAQNKNTRRRLFSEDGNGEVSGKVNQQPSQQHSLSQGQQIRILQKGDAKKTPRAPNATQQSQLTKVPSSDHPWANFSFDRERVYKAFFNPSSV